MNIHLVNSHHNSRYDLCNLYNSSHCSYDYNGSSSSGGSSSSIGLLSSLGSSPGMGAVAALYHLHAVCSVAGAMLKDHWVYGNRNHWTLLVHHAMTSYACGWCLGVPFLKERVFYVGVGVEVSSLFYNLAILFPVRKFAALQVVFVTLSNLNCVGLLWEVMKVGKEGGAVPYLWFWQLSYAVVCAGLLTFRFAGVWSAVQILRGSRGGKGVVMHRVE